MITRDEVRQSYEEADLGFFPITHERMTKLRNSINREMQSANLMEGTFHMKHPSNIKVHSNGCAELRCESYYFDDREAVTFNPDGFIGFAGWADDQNVQPILRGFMAWVKHEEQVAELN